MSENSNIFKVHFLPNDTHVEVNDNCTVLDAAHKANIYINSICGGDGICGKCKVILSTGTIDAPPTKLLSGEETEKNYILACEASVTSDLQILVPKETRLEGKKILLDQNEQHYMTWKAILEQARFKHDALVKKICLKLQPPTMDDSVADHERLYQAIMMDQNVELNVMQTGYRILKKLPEVLRENDWTVTVTLGHRGKVLEIIDVQPGDTSKINFGVAIDVGTTTVVACLLDLQTSKVVDSEAVYNTQMKYGEDYIQRIIYAIQNDALEEMQRSIVTDINKLISTLVKRNDIELEYITSVVCAGNTAMHHFLLGLDPERIRKEPYIPSANFIPPIRAIQLGIDINSRGLLYTLPSVAAYVGADITSGAAAIRLDREELPTLLIDIGTNGEVVLGNKEWMVCCSASAGPAFEGSGIKHGMRAAKGAIEIMHITKEFEVSYSTIGNVPPRGICGSGLLDCIAEMLRSGIIDRSGKFQKGIKTDKLREKDDEYEFVLVNRDETAIDNDIVISQADIANLIRSKGAIYAAVSLLIESMGLTIGDVHCVYMAGGFGNYLNVRNAITIGMLPDMPASRIKFVGNTSLTGAKMALLSEDAFETVQNIASQMTYFDLMGNQKYMEEFMSANFLPHTNLDEFPSVQEELAGNNT
ncbi:ferredoxin [Candidatus Scalindua japonica]|uniref:Ferredoxin n=1 Tax=Candidatus Scalindua japonica TaxID=1284222 RepID=A0A286TV07_9BACT|nr:ASKHA domain-containing protein [Candidatus Scalindua japonica]GAX59750.1 ferredoxin [Candidatus Scalindua japonica]